MVSIVITLYNLEGYIDRCLDSALGQTMKDIEVIVVNDCSTDSSLEHVMKYDDPRLRVITNEVNSGAGLSRRYGIAEAKGDYVMLLDGDDYIAPNYVEDLYKTAVEHDADIVSGGVTITEDKTFKPLVVRAKKLGVYTGKDMYLNETDHSVVCFLNNKVVRRSLYDKVQYSALRCYEDTPTLFKLFHYANKSVYIPNDGYFYVQREGSITKSKDKVKDTIFSFLYFMELVDFFKDKDNEFFKSIFNISTFAANFYLIGLNNIKISELEKYPEWETILQYAKDNMDE